MLLASSAERAVERYDTARSSRSSISFTDGNVAAREGGMSGRPRVVPAMHSGQVQVKK